MTVEEAISVLERLAHTESKWPGTEDTLESLDMALSAFRAQQDHFREATKMGWISSAVRLPERKDLYLTSWHGYVFIETWNGSVWSEKYQLGQAEYWMPLPEPPEEESHECCKKTILTKPEECMLLCGKTRHEWMQEAGGGGKTMAEYIDREALYKKLEHRYKYSSGAAHKSYGIAVDDVLDAPAADVAPVRHGHWKYYKKQGIAVCTECSFERKLDDNFGRAVSCPNCGAKMDGGNDNG